MQIVFVLMVLGIFGGFFGKDVLAVPLVPRLDYGDYSLEEVLDSSGATTADDQGSEPINGMDVAQVHLKNNNYDDIDNKIVHQNKKLPNGYFLIETVKQRDKRYTSYLTLCHFKICNMGRKRAARYLQMIRNFDDNDP